MSELTRRLESTGSPSESALTPLSLAAFLSEEFLPAVLAVEGGELAPAPHLNGWAGLIERHRFVALVSFRGSLKSTLCKSVIAHALRSHMRGAFDCVYFSATWGLAAWHTRRLKDYLADLAERWGWSDRTTGESVLRYEKPGASFVCEPAGLDQGARGKRADLLILDDVSDPKKMASMADIDRALASLQRRLIPTLKSKTSRIVVAATPIIENDIVGWIEKNPEFVTVRLPAILVNGEAAWPEKFPLAELERIKRLIGSKAFQAEFLLQAGGLLDSFIPYDVLSRAIAQIQVQEVRL